MRDGRKPGLVPQPLVARLRRRHDVVSKSVVEAIVRANPRLGELTGSFTRRLEGVTRHAISRALDLWPVGQPAPEDELEIYADQAADAARRGLSLDEVITSYEIGGSVMLADYWAQAEVGDQRELAELTAWHAREAPLAMGRVRTAFITAAMTEGFGGQSRRAYARALVTGTVTAGLAAAVGHGLKRGYVVFAIAWDDAEGIRRMRTALPDQGLLDEDPPKAPVVLIACDRASAEETVREFCAELSLDGLAVVMSHAEDAASVPEAASTVRRMTPLAVATMATGVLRPEMLLLDAVVAEHGELRAELGRIIRPVAERPELLDTLATLYKADLDRGRSASLLGIHRRTLTYRLERVSELTGLHPLSSNGIKLLQVAITAVRLDAAHGTVINVEK
ncbi:PucR family transcriptional regulator [Lentzea sp. HUAS TT2]|uniref:PucR family transcriptional regulator n=1 Tax=Lentzea sp. HUAS TT2 TaxID=3447454 RepID=UPI003F6F276E